MCFKYLQKNNTDMKNRNYKKFHALLLFLLFMIFQGGTVIFAQITLNSPNITPAQAVNDVLLGTGVTALNITVNGSPAIANTPQNSVRHFTNTSAIFPLSDGVLLKTNGGSNVTDPDLNSIASPLRGGVVIEFDFIPDGDSLSFSYIFTSAEYGSFTCSQWFDVFGFFISGPGISGPYSNNSQNIAIVPGSANIPVGINTVNNGTNSDSGGHCNAADPNWQNNSIYYTTSYNSVYNSSNIESGFSQYNGSTVELKANASVICGETYHIKLAIANVSDNSFDSGVFLKAGSFTSEPVIEINGNNTTSAFLDSVIVEGCDQGDFCFTRPFAESADTAVAHYTISGTATYGVDYTIPNLPNTGDSIVLLPGETEFCLSIVPIDDGIIEGLESVFLTTYTVNGCGDTTYMVGSLWIADKPLDLIPDAGQDTVVCDGGAGTLNGTPTTPNNDVAWTYSGPGTITFTPNAQDLNAEVTFSTPGTYTLFLTESNDSCFLEAVDSMHILYGEVDIIVSSDTIICENGEATLTALANGGTNFTYFWSHTTDNGPTQSVLPNVETTYTVHAENTEGCGSSIEEITVSVLPPLGVTSSPSQTICPGESINISATGSDGNGGPYTYEWTDSNGDVVSTDAVYEASPLATSTYTVTVTDDCETSAVTSTSEVVVALLPEVLFSVVDGEICSPATFELVNNTDPSLLDEVYWYISDNQTFTELDSVEVDIKLAGKYDVHMVIVTPDGCIDSAHVNGMLTVYPKPKADFTYYPNPVTILNTEVQFQNYSKGAIYYEWNFEEGEPFYSSSKNPTVDFPKGIIGDYDVDLLITSEFDCTDTIRKTITVLPEVMIFSPNAFTPDGDEHNGIWKPSIQGVDLYGVTIEIFNRWGEKIWESHDIDYGWDGTYGVGGGKVRPGTYVWKITASDLINDNMYEWDGIVTVIY